MFIIYVSQWKTRSCQVDKFETGKCNLLQLAVSRSRGMVAVCWLKTPPAQTDAFFAGPKCPVYFSGIFTSDLSRFCFNLILFELKLLSLATQWQSQHHFDEPEAPREPSREPSAWWLQGQFGSSFGDLAAVAHVPASACMACDCKNMLETDLSGVENNANGRKSGWCSKACQEMHLMSHVPSPTFVLRWDLLKSLVRFPPGKDENKNQHDLVQGCLDLSPCAGYHKHGHLVWPLRSSGFSRHAACVLWSIMIHFC